MSRISASSSPSNSTGTSSTLVSSPRRIRAQLTTAAAKRTKRTQQRKTEAEPQRCADDCRGIDSASGQLCACALGSPSSAETSGETSGSGGGSGASSGDEGAARAGTQLRGYSSSSSSDERAAAAPAPKRRVRARAVVTPFGIARPRSSGSSSSSMDASASRPAPQPRLFARAASSTRPSFNGTVASRSGTSDSSDSDVPPSRRHNGIGLSSHTAQPAIPPSSSPPLSSSSSGARSRSSATSSRRSIADVFERLMADEAARRTPVRQRQGTELGTELNGTHVATPAPAALLELDEEHRTKRRDDKSRLLSLARSTQTPPAAQATPRVRMAAGAPRREGDEEQQTQTPRGAAEYAARLKALRRGRSESPRDGGVGVGEVTPKAEASREVRAGRGEREEVGRGMEQMNGRYEAEEEAHLDSSAQESGSVHETQREVDADADAEMEAESDFEAEMERERLAMEAQQAARPASISPRRQRVGKRLSSSFISSGNDATPRAPPPPPLLPADRISPAFAFPAAPASPLPPSSPLFAHWSSNSNGRSNGASFAHGGNDGGSESNSAASSPRRSSHRRSNPNSPTLSVSARAPSHEALERLGRALGATETLLPPEPESERGRREEQGEEEQSQTQTSSESMRAHRTVRFSPTPSYRESSPVREEWEGVLEEEEEEGDENADEEEEDELAELRPSAEQESSDDILAPSSSSDMPPPRPLAPASSPARAVSRHVFVPSTPSRAAAAPATASATATRSTSPPLALGARTAGLSLALASPGTPHPPGFFGVSAGAGGGAAAASPSVRRLAGSSLRPRRSHDSFSLDALTHESSLSAAELAPLQEASDDEIVAATRGPPRQSTPPLLRASTTQRQPAAAVAVVAQEACEEKDASLHATLEQLLRVLSQRPIALPASVQPPPLPELQLDTSALLATTERLAQLRRDEADAARRRLEAGEKDAEAGAALSETRAKLGSLAEAVRQTRAGAQGHDDALADVVPPSYVVLPPARSSHLRTTLLILAHLLFLALVVFLAEAGAAHRFHTTYYDPFHPALFPAAPHDSSLLSGAEALLEALPARGSRLGGVAAATLQPLLRFLSAPPERAPSFVS